MDELIVNIELEAPLIVNIELNAVGSPEGSGGDVSGPETNNADYIPQWDGANSKLLKNGLLVPAGGLAGLTVLGNKVDKVEGSSLLPDTEAAKIHDVGSDNETAASIIILGIDEIEFSLINSYRL